MPGGVNPSQTAVPDTTPRLQDSSLQQGDVAMLKEGQQVMKQAQRPATPPAKQGGQPATGQPDYTAPAPIPFLSKRGANTLTADTLPQPGRAQDFEQWLPFLEKIATSPGVSGPLQAAYVKLLSNLNISKAQGEAVVVHMSDYDNAVEQMLNDNK